MEREAVLVTFRQDFTCHQSSPPCDKFTVNIASVHYTHSATFVSEVQGFVSDFQVSLARMRDSIKDAAVGVAKGLVRQVTQQFNSEILIPSRPPLTSSFPCTLHSLPPLHTSQPPSPPRTITVELSVTETDLVVAEDLSRPDSSAIVMKVSHWVTVFVYIALYCIDSTVLYTYVCII